jgi:hypothetical protein
MTTITDIRTALIAMLGTISKANGYANDIPSGHVYRCFDSAIFNSKDAELYPKVFLLIDTGDQQGLPSNRYEREVYFIILMFITQDLASSPQETDAELQVRIESFIEDLDRAVSINNTLGGIANEVLFESFTTDGGITKPEAGALCRINVKYQVQR